MDFETQSIIIDSGSLNYKCGFSGENEPSIILPSVVGRPTDIDCLLGFGGRDRYVGEQALDMISIRIKENYCYVAEDYDVELLNLKKEKIENKRVKLPDGTELYLDESSFKSTEILFQPYYNDKKSIIDTFMKTYDSIGDQNLKSTVLDSIVLSGGNTKLPGFSKRFQKEIEKATGENVNIHSTENPLNSNWLAASMMTMQTNTMNSKWITMDQYDENGPCISHSGCYERNII
eukprot:gene8925-874_t